MAIDTGTSLDTGASDITYTGDEGPRSPEENRRIASAILGDESGDIASEIWSGMSSSERNEWGNIENFINSDDFKTILINLQTRRGLGNMKMASADPILQDEYDQYVFDLQEHNPGVKPMSIEQFREQAISGMASGGIARLGYKRGRVVEPGGYQGNPHLDGPQGDASGGSGEGQGRSGALQQIAKASVSRPVATQRPTEMLGMAGDRGAQRNLRENIQESQRTGAYARQLGLPAVRRDVWNIGKPSLPYTKPSGLSNFNIPNRNLFQHQQLQMLKNYFDEKRRQEIEDEVLEGYDFSDIEKWEAKDEQLSFPGWGLYDKPGLPSGYPGTSGSLNKQIATGSTPHLPGLEPINTMMNPVWNNQTQQFEYPMKAAQGGIARLGYAGGQLVKNNPDGSRPGYYGPDIGHWSDPGATASTQEEKAYQKQWEGGGGEGRVPPTIPRGGGADVMPEFEIQVPERTETMLSKTLSRGNKLKQKMYVRVLTNSIAEKLGRQKKSYLPSVMQSDLFRTPPEGMNMEGLFDEESDMSVYGLSGSDLTRTKLQYDALKIAEAGAEGIGPGLGQEDFEAVYGQTLPK